MVQVSLPVLILSLGSALVVFGTKLDALIRQWDIYPKGENTGYAIVNSHNFKPIFTQEQLAASIQATVLFFSSLCTATVVDLDTLH